MSGPGARPPLSAVLEAVLLVTDEPVPASALAQLAEADPVDVDRMLDALARGYREQDRGFELRLVAGGWRLLSLIHISEPTRPY